jgi:hypothetical protein
MRTTFNFSRPILVRAIKFGNHCLKPFLHRFFHLMTRGFPISYLKYYIIRLYTTISLCILYLIHLWRHVSGYKPIFWTSFPFSVKLLCY